MLYKKRLIVKRTILVSVTLLAGALFFSLLSGKCQIKSKADDTWQTLRTEKMSGSEQLTDSFGIDINTVTDEDMPLDVYKDTDPKIFKFLWQEDFNSDEINIDRWSSVNKINNDNNELQAYMPQNVKVAEGVLYLTADICTKYGKKYSSGMIETLNKDEFLYGKIEIRASMPSGKGLFPAIWMIPETGNYYEIDILESVRNEPTLIYGGNHYYYGGVRQKNFNSATINNPQSFHTYAVEWQPDKIIWYLDNKIYHQTSRGVPNENMYLILNLAVGGNWPGDPDSKTVFPNSFKIDYIRVYEYTGNK